MRYAELTLTPYSSIVRGIAAEAFCDAVEDARARAARDFGLQLRWCFDIPGEAGVPAANLTLDVALNQRPDGLISFGLGGPERGVPRAQFQPHFDAARAAGLHSVPHAGESTGPETVWEALTVLGAERIGHGIAAARDEALLAHLRTAGLPLEVCPTSNVRTRSVPIEEHPLAVLAAARCRSPSTPTIRRCFRQPSTASTRSLPSCSVWTPQAWRTWLEPRSASPSWTRPARPHCSPKLTNTRGPGACRRL